MGLGLVKDRFVASRHLLQKSFLFEQFRPFPARYSLEAGFHRYVEIENMPWMGKFGVQLRDKRSPAGDTLIRQGRIDISVTYNGTFALESGEDTGFSAMHVLVTVGGKKIGERTRMHRTFSTKYRADEGSDRSVGRFAVEIDTQALG